MFNLEDLYPPLPGLNTSGVGANATKTFNPFPPGLYPPTDPWFYDIPSYPLNIKFRDYSVNPYRNENIVYSVFEQALRQAAAQGDERLPARELRWTSGHVELAFDDEVASRHGVLLTYDKWFRVLREVLAFTRHYREVDFFFEIFDLSSGEELYAGVGQLG